jgi:hypothetical protein
MKSRTDIKPSSPLALSRALREFRSEKAQARLMAKSEGKGK